MAKAIFFTGGSPGKDIALRDGARRQPENMKKQPRILHYVQDDRVERWRKVLFTAEHGRDDGGRCFALGWC
jgi:hypothetical protein